MSDQELSYDFIIGIPRSGTTLLGLRLNRVPGVFSAIENRLIVNLLKDFEKGRRAFDKTAAYVNKIMSEQNNFPFTIDPKIRNVLKDSTNKSLKELAIDLMSCIEFDHRENKPSYRHFIEKNPGYSLLWAKLVKYFPEAKFIWMTRDPRAFVNSRLEKVNPKNRVNNPYFLAYLWNEYHQEFNRLKKEHQHIFVNYEKLVTNPEDELMRILTFLNWNVSYDVKQLLEKDNYSDNLDLVDQRKTIKFRDLDQQINASRLNSWKESLPDSLSADIAYLCVKTASSVGYHLPNKLSLSRKIWLRLITLHWYIGAKLFVLISKER